MTPGQTSFNIIICSTDNMAPSMAERFNAQDCYKPKDRFEHSMGRALKQRLRSFLYINLCIRKDCIAR